MTSADEGRIERLVRECRHLNAEPNPATIAEIMVEQDMPWTDLGDANQGQVTNAFAEYEEAAARLLLRRAP
jgi:hypothetical protein